MSSERCGALVQPLLSGKGWCTEADGHEGPHRSECRNKWGRHFCVLESGHRPTFHADGAVMWGRAPLFEELEQAAAESAATPPEYKPVVTQPRTWPSPKSRTPRERLVELIAAGYESVTGTRGGHVEWAGSLLDAYTLNGGRRAVGVDPDPAYSRMASDHCQRCYGTTPPGTCTCDDECL